MRNCMSHALFLPLHNQLNLLLWCITGKLSLDGLSIYLEALQTFIPSLPSVWGTLTYKFIMECNLFISSRKGKGKYRITAAGYFLCVVFFQFLPLLCIRYLLFVLECRIPWVKSLSQISAFFVF